MHPKQRLFALVAGLVIVVAAIWYFLRRAETHDAAPPTAAEEEPTAPVAETPPPPPRPAPAAPAPSPKKEAEVAEDGIGYMPAHDDDPRPDGYAHFHPITAKHRRIYAENGLIESLNGAMDVKDVAGLRRLLEKYRREYPEDEWELQGGYAAIADCLEHPGDDVRAAAKSWVERHNGSPLKRFVNRHCLE
jgi:hypothetical protein